MRQMISPLVFPNNVTLGDETLVDTAREKTFIRLPMPTEENMIEENSLGTDDLSESESENSMTEISS